MATPIIGAINGPVFTGGLEMALGCDFLIASQRAVFADTHARVGILPGGGMTGEVIDAARAERIGLVTEVVAHEQLVSRAVELATAVAEVPAPIMGGLKQIYVSGAAAVTDPALAAEQRIADAASDLSDLGGRFRAVTERNRQQLKGDRGR